MAFAFFLVLLVLSFMQHVPMVSDVLDEATRERMQQRAVQLSQEMTRLLQELEQSTLEQSGFAWGAQLFAALQQWQFWAIAGVLLLLFGLSWRLTKRSRVVDSSSEEERSDSSSSNTVKEEEEEGRREDAADERNPIRISAERIQRVMQNAIHRGWVVDELLADLLHMFPEHD